MLTRDDKHIKFFKILQRKNSTAILCHEINISEKTKNNKTGMEKT